jgi:uncharacterized membrane protein
VLLTVALALPEPAAAGLEACNRSARKIHVAIALPSDQGGWASAGWWTIEPDRCEALVELRLTDRTVYAYAQSTSGYEWGAPNFFCVEETPKLKVLDAEGDCASGLAVGMVKHNLGDTMDYTITFE